jgi:hypothetical protein
VGLDYAIVTAAVLLGMAGSFYVLLRVEGLRTVAPLVALVGLAEVFAGAIEPAFHTAYEAGFRHANGEGTTQLALAPLFMLLGLVVTSVLVATALRRGGLPRFPQLMPPLPSPDDPVDEEDRDDDDEDEDEETPADPDDETPAENAALVPWLGLAGLAVVILVGAPSPVHAAAFDEGGRVFVASFAFAAFVIGIAAIALLFDVGETGVAALAVVGIGAPALGLLVSLAASAVLTGLLAGVAVALLLPAGLAVVRTLVTRQTVTALVAPLVAGVVILTAAAALQGWTSHFEFRVHDIGNEGPNPLPAPPLPVPAPAPNPPCPGPSPVGALIVCQTATVSPSPSR